MCANKKNPLHLTLYCFTHFIIFFFVYENKKICYAFVLLALLHMVEKISSCFSVSILFLNIGWLSVWKFRIFLSFLCNALLFFDCVKTQQKIIMLLDLKRKKKRREMQITVNILATYSKNSSQEKWLLCITFRHILFIILILYKKTQYGCNITKCKTIFHSSFFCF